MPYSNRILIAAIAIGLAALAGSGGLHAQTKTGAQKKIYCWNEGGSKVCGDALPANAADSARTEISTKSGMQTGQVARALTDAERTAAALAAETASKQAEADAMAQRRDLAMVESYMTEADLRRAYGERTELLDETLKASTLGVTNLRLSLLALLRQASDREMAGEVVPKSMTNTIRGQHDELLRQQQILVAQKKDRAALDADLQDAVARYRALKAAPGESPVATTGASAPSSN
ncbi:hypothetical protein [Thermomonas sp. HDW16]|uniref:hypothetical protein n=1 Tax=Thermomonas sp. HDW16 TaxID=2714945 RepID=UPI00140E73E1|nr:hypothetical protein [Thermomonas sp. HDW16]QIL19626.1 hypothetical protein G7079_02145 [Thermomonas sp. HDW16]